MPQERKQPNEKGEWKCSKCEQWLPSSSYSKNKQQKSGLHYACRACSKIRVRQYNIKGKYGIDASAITLLIEEQNHKCAICFNPIELSLDNKKSNYATRANVDHDHSSNKVRGLLCTLCNMGLGKFKDNKTYLKNAIEYLNKHGGKV